MIETEFLPRCRLAFCDNPIAVNAPLDYVCAQHLHSFAHIYQTWSNESLPEQCVKIIEWSLKNPEQSQL